jgi:hypothetical protein
LHPWPLLGHHEFAAHEVAAGRGKQNRHLDRKDVLAVEILMQTVEIAGHVT